MDKKIMHYINFDSIKRFLPPELSEEEKLHLAKRAQAVLSPAAPGKNFFTGGKNVLRKVEDKKFIVVPYTSYSEFLKKNGEEERERLIKEGKLKPSTN